MTTLKVLKVPIMILLQTVPKNINLKQLRIVHKMMHFSCLLIGRDHIEAFIILLTVHSDELIQLCRETYEVRTDLTSLRPQVTF